MCIKIFSSFLDLPLSFTSLGDTINGCPVAGCPVVCDLSNQYVCPGVPDPSNPNCPVPNICVDRQFAIPLFSGDDCGTVCPISCPEGEVTCPGGFDERGCPMPDTCLPPPPGPGTSNPESAWKAFRPKYEPRASNLYQKFWSIQVAIYTRNMNVHYKFTLWNMFPNIDLKILFYSLWKK